MTSVSLALCAFAKTQRCSPLDVVLQQFYCIQLCAAMAFLHANDVVHGALTSKSVHLMRDGKLRLSVGNGALCAVFVAVVRFLSSHSERASVCTPKRTHLLSSQLEAQLRVWRAV